MYTIILGPVSIATPYLPLLSSYASTARNLKFYPLAFKRAMINEPSLARVVEKFRIRLCTGKEKVFAACDTWELLNLTPDEAVSLTTRISESSGLSIPALQAVLNTYLIQTTGKDDLERYFRIERTPQYLCPKTIHYSWPKGAGELRLSSFQSVRVKWLALLQKQSPE